MRRLLLVGLTLLVTVLGILPGYAEKRVALVIGNNRYPNLPANEQLQKAVNDATAVGTALASIGFEVIPAGENLSRQEIIDRLDAAAGKLSPGDTVFFFFSGHGVAVDSANYILPADVPDIASNQVTRLKGAALSEEYIAEALAGSGARVVIVLDACRDNPFARGGTKGVGGERGLRPHDPPKGVFALYAASRGQAALDRLYDGDPNPNSVFTRALLPKLSRPGLDVKILAAQVRNEVEQLAGTVRHDQRPAYYDELSGGELYLAGLPPAAAPPPQTVPTVAEDSAARDWKLVETSTGIEALEAFKRRHPGTFEADLAGLRIAALKKTQVAVVPAAPTVPPAPVLVAPVILSPPMAPSIAPDPCSGPITVSLGARCATPLSAAQERALKPNESFKECGNCPEMIVVPAGSFNMGSALTEQGRANDEGPQHQVTFARPFAVGKFHITVDQFKAFADATGHDGGSSCWTFESGRWEKRTGRSWRSPGFPQKGSHPVVCVNLEDAKAYVKWLNTSSRKENYRLLSEAEWEYAARARTTPTSYPRFWFGDNDKELCRFGNGADEKARDTIQGAKGWAIAPCSDGYAFTAPVGSFPANDFGLNDMAGNAWQWTADCWNDSYKGAPSDGSVWSAGDCGRVVVRGGSWYFNSNNIRAANRYKTAADYRVNNNGFRVARTLVVP